MKSGMTTPMADFPGELAAGNGAGFTLGGMLLSIDPSPWGQPPVPEELLHEGCWTNSQRPGTEIFTQLWQSLTKSPRWRFSVRCALSIRCV